MLDKIRAFCYLSKFYLFKKNVVDYYKQLQHQQYMSLDELEYLNWQKRKRILKYAYEKVPYYREKFKSVGLNIDDIRKPEDYSKVPLLKREDIQSNFKRMISEEALSKDSKLMTTGGSTGEPLKVMSDTRIPLESFRWRVWNWWKVPPGANEAIVLRMVKNRKIDHLINNILWWPTSRVKVDASSMKRADLELFLKQFNRVKPQIVWGYVGAIDHIASFIEENSFEIAPPKAILATSAPTTVVQRKKIESAFGAPLYDQYGCCEIFWLAAQCYQKQGLHMFHDARFIEFTDDLGNPKSVGEMGNIVVTDLENYVFPFIRYVNGDMGRSLPCKCSCGINLPIMDHVKGRQTDLVKLPNRTFIAGAYLTTIFDDFPDAVKGFQVRQKKDYSIILSYIPNQHAQDLSTILEKVLNTLKQKTEFQVEITLQAVNNIPHDRGKLQYVISEITD